MNPNIASGYETDFTKTAEFARRTLSAGTLTGDRVVNGRNEELGKIQELMIDLRSGRVAYAVLSFGGFLGMGDKYFAIPWQAMRVDQVNRQVVLDVDKSRLESAPGFEKDNWPDMGNPDWGAQIHKYYNIPYER